MPATLYELTDQLNEAFELASLAADENQGEVPRDFVQVLKEIEGEIDQKLIGCGKVFRSLEGLADALKAEADRLASRKRVIESNIDRLKSYIQESLRAIGETKKQAGQFKFSIVRNSAPTLKVLDRDAIPVRYFKPVPVAEVDVMAIKSAAKDGKDVPGVELSYGDHLRVA